LWALRIWPAVIVAMWAIMVPTGGVIQPNDRIATWTGIAAGLAAIAHLLCPYDDRVRYTALVANEVAILDRAAAFIFTDQIRRHIQVTLVGASLWLVIAAAKLVVFLLTAAVVERERTRREAAGGGG
jgi:hypothetical protein